MLSSIIGSQLLLIEIKWVKLVPEGLSHGYFFITRTLTVPPVNAMFYVQYTVICKYLPKI